MKYIFLLFSFSIFAQNNFTTPFELGNGNQSATYEECIAFYEKLDESFTNIQMIHKGTSDSGKPLHLVLFSSDGKYDFDEYFTKNKAVILSEEDFRNMQETIYLLSIPGMRESIVAAKKEKITKCAKNLDW